ncbi:MAG: lytic transglycosylase domain-containing protein [Clostridia bacterium]|nr:lytic transglycosylase domain-containing protein [Clostridia bacterium]
MKAFLITVSVIVVLAAIICTVLFAVVPEVKKQSYPREYSEYVGKYCAEYDVPEPLVYAVIKTESNFKADAVSRVGAIGLMQLMPDTFSWLSRLMKVEEQPDMISDPETNIRYGVYYLHHLYNRFGGVSWDTALAGFNAGHGRVGNWLKDSRYSDDGTTLKYIPIEETSNYVEKVNRIKEVYEELYY